MRIDEEERKKRKERKKVRKNASLERWKAEMQKSFYQLWNSESPGPQIAIHSGLFEIRRNFCLEWFSFSSVATEFNQVESFRFPSLSLSLSQRLTLFLPFDTFNRITSVIIIIIIVVLLPRRISLSRKNVTGSVNRYSPVNKGRWRRRLRRRLRRRRWRDISVLNWENWEKSECTPSECLQSKGNV